MSEASAQSGKTGTRGSRAAPPVKPNSEASATDKPEASTNGKPAAEKKPRKPRSSSKYSPTSVIVVVTPDQKNPKRAGSASFDRFALYPTGGNSSIQVADALKAGVWTGDLAWDYEHGFISIDGESQPLKERKVPVRKPKEEAKAAEDAKNEAEDDAAQPDAPTKPAEEAQPAAK